MTSNIPPINDPPSDQPIVPPSGPQGTPPESASSSQTPLEQALVKQYGKGAHDIVQMLTKSMAMMMIQDLQHEQARMKALHDAQKQG